MLLAFASISKKNVLGISLEFSNRARERWQHKNCSFRVETCLLSRDFPIPVDQSGFSYTFDLDVDEQCEYILSLSIHGETGGVFGSLRSSSPEVTGVSVTSTSTPQQQSLGIDVFFQERWEYDPFSDLPVEVLALIFTCLVEPSDLHVDFRQHSSIGEYLQRLRLVNVVFSKLALNTLCKVIGHFDYVDRRLPFGPNRPGLTRLEPLALFHRYPVPFAPHLRRLIVRDQRKYSREETWKILVDAFSLCKNLDWVVLILKPPFCRKNRRLAIHLLQALPNLRKLQFTCTRVHNDQRWDTQDLSCLLSRELQVSELTIQGWDLREHHDFDGARKSTKLVHLVIWSCPVHHKTLCAFLPFLTPAREEASSRPDFRFFYFSFWEGELAKAKDLLPFLLQSCHLTSLTIELRPPVYPDPNSDPELRPVVNTMFLDEHIYAFSNLTQMALDAGDPSSALVSPDFLLNFPFPRMRRLHLKWMYLSPSSILSFLSDRHKYSTEPFFLALITFYGDIPWTLNEFEERVKVVDKGEDASARGWKQWEDAAEGVLIYEGKSFSLCWNSNCCEPEPMYFW
ncbi:hypothetical protein BT69DRAFT_1279857 [Atractiella rhizophila]|nr:hypothetical protein BT69DRAFT_1279857 [Atractiella rhizophila]